MIYTFFQLLITYLGGERSLLIILHGRHPIPHPFPVNLILRPMDVSDPWTLLNLKRGVLRESLMVVDYSQQLTRRIRPDQTAARHRHGHSEVDGQIPGGRLCCGLGIHVHQHRLQHFDLFESLVS